MSRSGGQIAVHCDCCNEVVEIEMTMLATEGGWDTRNVEKELEDSGWVKDLDDEDLDFCSDECFNDYKTKNCQKRKRRRRKHY